MPIVFTPFSTEPIEVDEEEAAAMARQGLLRDTQARSHPHRRKW